MKGLFLLLVSLMCSAALFAQEKIFIHKTDKVSLGALLLKTDSVYFSSDASKVWFRVNNQPTEFAVNEIDSLTFGANSNTVTIHYNGTSASVINPLAFEGVTVSVKGADVTVNSTSTDTEINYLLKGTSADGQFKIYSASRFNLKLSGVNLTNTDGAPVNIQSKKKCNLTLVDGTTNTLADGTAYATTTEDQKAALFSEGQIDIDGNGSLSVKSNSAHAICSDDYIHILSGNITVTGATKDGIHANDYFRMSGGTLNVTTAGDGVECESGYILISGGNLTAVTNSADAKGLVCDSTLTISGGTIKLTLGGNQSKGIKATQKMLINGGDINITQSGGVVLVTSGSGYDPAYSCGIKGDADIDITSGKITIVGSGAGGRGISSAGNLNIADGTLTITTSGAGATYKNASAATDSYSAVCINSDGNLTIAGGTTTASSSGSGGKALKANGTITIGTPTSSPTITLTTTGTKFVVSGSDYNHPKTMVADGTITIKNGTNTLSSADDGIHSETSVVIDGGSTTISKSYEGIESKIITINGGFADVTASNDGINTSMGTQTGGTESNDGSCLYVKGGTLVVNATNGDAIDSNGNLEISGGITIANGPLSGVEEAVDFNGTFKMTGGLFIGAGSASNMTKAMSTSSTQANMYLSTTTAIPSSTFLHIQNAAGTDVLTFKSKNGGYKFLFSSSLLTKGSNYSIYTGGSYSGGSSNNGLYTGGTYSSSGATLKKTVTLSTTSTVNSISF